MLAQFQVTDVPQEWLDLEAASSTLRTQIMDPDDEQRDRLLDALRLELPEEPTWTDMQHSRSGTKWTLPPENREHDFYVAQLPLALIVSSKYYLTKLAVRLTLDTAADAEGALCRDLCPSNELLSKSVFEGGLDLDVTKALGFVLTATGVAGASGVADGLGLKLKMPFKWTSASLTVQGQGRNTHYVDWLVTDKGIPDGEFAPCVLIQTPRGQRPAITAEMHCELRFSGPRGWFRGCIKTADDPPQRYVMGH